MGVQRFVGSNNREAMGRVRAALGDDALILANRATDQGVEILALAEDDSSGYAPSEQAVPDRAGQAAVAPAQQRVPHHAPAGPALLHRPVTNTPIPCFRVGLNSFYKINFRYSLANV